MMLLDSLKPLSKILKPEYTIDPGDMERFNVPLRYLGSTLDNYIENIPDVSLIDESVKKCHNKCIQLHGRVKAATAEYNKLNSAVARLKKCIIEMDMIQKDTERAWSSLTQIEEKLK